MIRGGVAGYQSVRSNKCGYITGWIKKDYWKAIIRGMGIKKALTFCVRAF
jgi:hypothetical protein